MATDPSPIFSRAAGRQILLQYLSITIAMLITCYGILWWYARQEQQAAGQLFLANLVENLSHKILSKQVDLSLGYLPKSRAIQDYQLIIFSDSGRVFSISTSDDNLNTNVPNLTLSTAKDALMIEHSQGFESWQKLPNQHRLYARVTYTPLIQYFHSPIYSFPILLALLCTILVIRQLQLRYDNWYRLIDYLQNLQQAITTKYQPLKLPASYIQPEIRQLTQIINRLTFRMHQYIQLSNEQHYRQLALIDNAPAPLFLINRKGKLSYFNKQFAHTFGTPFDSNVVYMLGDFLTGKDKETQQLLTNIQDHHLFVTLPVTNLQRDSHFDLRLNPFYNRHGQLKGFTGVLQVVTRYYDQLQQAWLDQRQQSEKLASFDKLWAVLGHELRTPLSGMIGMIDLLADNAHSFNHDQHEILMTLKHSSQTMLQLLNDMLDMAKMDAGKLQSNIASVNVLQLLRQVCDLMVGNARRNHISLFIFVAPDAPRYFESDDSRVRQIVLNLMSNAIKFTKEGYVALIVDKLTNEHPIILQKFPKAVQEKQPIASQWLRITVKDSGMGIQESEQKKLFSYFNQANESISRQFGGTGLGLAISNNFSQMLGGFIHLQSEMNVGSEFQVYLPMSNPILIAPFNFRFQHLKVFLIVISSFNVVQLFNRFLQYSELAGQIFSEVNDEMVAQINALTYLDLTPIFLIDDVAYTNYPELFQQITIFPTASKILASIEPERSINPEIRCVFDAILVKPLLISSLVAELTRLYQYKTVEKSSLTRRLSAELAFRQFLEQHVNEVEPPSTNAAVEKIPQQPSISLNKSISPSIPRILVAEDNVVNQKIVQKQLNILGYEAIMANNGKEAIELLQAHRSEIGMILMDCRMPILDGIEATREIRARKYSLPIIALTANDTDDDRVLCLQAGMDNFLTKPLTQEKLTDILNQYLI